MDCALKAHWIFHRMSVHVCSIFFLKKLFFDSVPIKSVRRKHVALITQTRYKTDTFLMNKYGENHFERQIANRNFQMLGRSVMSNNKVSVIPTMEKVNYVDFLFSHTAYKKATVVFLSTKSALLLGTLV